MYSKVLNKLKTKNEYIAYFFIFPTIFVLLIIFIFPMFYNIYLSFRSVMADFSSRFIGLENYKEALRDPLVWLAFKNTFVFTLSATALHLLVGLGIALFLHQSFKGRKTLRMIMLSPWIVSMVVAGSIWRWMYDPFGLMNETLIGLGVIDNYYPWLSTAHLAMPAVIVAYTWKGYPFVMIILLASLQAVPEVEYEAAVVDGASTFQKFRYITLPHIKFMFLIAALLAIITNFKLFTLLRIVTDGGPANATEVLSLHIYRQSFEFIRYGYAAAIAVLMFLVSLGLGIFYTKVFSR